MRAVAATTRRSGKSTTGAVLLVGALVLAACGSDEGAAPAGSAGSAGGAGTMVKGMDTDGLVLMPSGPALTVDPNGVCGMPDQPACPGTPQDAPAAPEQVQAASPGGEPSANVRPDDRAAPDLLQPLAAGPGGEPVSNINPDDPAGNPVAGSAIDQAAPIPKEPDAAKTPDTPPAQASAAPSASARTGRPDPPPAPIVIPGPGSGEVTATVTAASTGGLPFQITVEYSTAGGARRCIVPGGQGSCVISDLTNGTAYSFYACAFTGGGKSGCGVAGPSAAPVTPSNCYAPAGGNVDWSGCDKRGAYLKGAVLRGANLSGANLSGADLSGADLTDAILIRADLTGADLRGADLWNVRAMSATLTRAKLGDARIYGLNLDGANVDGVKWDNCPTGQRLWRSSRSDPGTCRAY